MLPWAEYEAILRFHLGRLPRMLDYQKQLVRTLIAVLDAFHFNLSALEKKPSEPEPVAVEEQIEPVVEKPTEGEDVAPEAEEEDLAEILEQVEETEKEKQTPKIASSKIADTTRSEKIKYFRAVS